MYGNSFFNPYLNQPYYQTSNLMRGLGNMNNMGNLGRTVSGINNTTTGLSGIKGLLGKFSFSSLLNGASKTLNVVNQAIPIFYQVKPIINNAKTMFRIVGAVKDDSTPTTKNTNNYQSMKQTSSNKINNMNNNITFQDTDYKTFNEENPTFFI